MTDSPVNRLNGHGHDLAAGPSTAGGAGGGTEPIFTNAEVEQLFYRRFNPLASLTAGSLASALDAWDVGDLRPAAILWDKILRRDATLITVSLKRKEAVALREWTVNPLDDSPEAADQAAALTHFYERLRAGHALNRHVAGGFALLAAQMMDSVAYEYAAHHLIWRPDAARSFTLPSGRQVASLTATFEQVPLEYFEARTGELRFLGVDQGYVGQPLAPNSWMVTTGPGLMHAASITHYYKRLATHDLINFSGKFGSPGLVVHTTAAKGSPEGDAAEAAARSIAGNYRGVVFGSPENKVEFLWPQGGTGASNLPMHTIQEDARRELTVIWMGEDLSTMSRGGAGKSVGASLQASAQERREQGDCTRVTETLQNQVDPVVIGWFFGPDAPILAEVILESPINEDRALLGNLVTQAVGLGARVPIRPVAKRLGLPVVEPDSAEACFAPPRAPVAPVADPAGDAEAVAANAAVLPPRLQRRADQAAAALATRARLELAQAVAKDLAPLRERFASLLALNDDPELQRAAALKLQRDWPHLSRQIGADPAAAGVLAGTQAAGVLNGLVEAAVATHQAPPASLNPATSP